MVRRSRRTFSLQRQPVGVLMVFTRNWIKSKVVCIISHSEAADQAVGEEARNSLQCFFLLLIEPTPSSELCQSLSYWSFCFFFFSGSGFDPLHSPAVFPWQRDGESFHTILEVTEEAPQEQSDSANTLLWWWEKMLFSFQERISQIGAVTGDHRSLSTRSIINQVKKRH